MTLVERSSRTVVAGLLALIISGGSLRAADQAVSPTPDPQVEALRKAAAAETDRTKEEDLWRQSAAEEYADDQRRAAVLHELWKNERDPKKR
ncbi:MAG TPA: hypothetical protein VII74_07890 [Chthoniobacterales bacterium]